MEIVDSVDEFEVRSIEGKDFPNFEMLDARIASALNKKIQNSYFKMKVSLENRKLKKRIGLFAETDRFHDLRLLPRYWRSRHRS